MNLELGRTFRGVGRCCVLLTMVLLLGVAVAAAEEIAIEVAPSTLNISSHGKVVTVHTDIAYPVVEVSSVYLNGVIIHSWKADNRGNFVAKFLMDDVKALDGLIIGGPNTLTMVGLTVGGYSFWGEQEVMVIDVSGRVVNDEKSSEHVS